MSYTPHTWVDNETITAAKLNNLEDGVQEAAQSGGGGYDAEIKIYHSSNSSDSYEITVVSGTFASLLEMLQNNTTPNILIRVSDGMTYARNATSNVYFYNWGTDYITMHFLALKNANADTYSLDWVAYHYLVWNNSNEVFID